MIIGELENCVKVGVIVTCGCKALLFAKAPAPAFAVAAPLVNSEPYTNILTVAPIVAAGRPAVKYGCTVK